jgi:hypothetical protein
MPVRLSGPLVAEARRSAKRFHRSVTGQIEHWAALGKAIEARLPGETLEELLGEEKKAMTIGQVGDVNERERVADILVRFVAQSPVAGDSAWLDEIRRSSVPGYGTRNGSGDGIVAMDSAGVTRPVFTQLVEP